MGTKANHEHRKSSKREVAAATSEPDQPPTSQPSKIDPLDKTPKTPQVDGLTRWGALVGLITGIVTLPKTVLEMYRLVVAKPHTEAVSGDLLIVSYDPAASSLQISSSLSLMNSGTSDDDVVRMWAKLKPPNTASAESANFAPTDFKLSTKGQALSFPVSVSKGTSLDLTWQATSRVTSDSIPEQKGDWIVSLSISMRGSPNPLTADFRIFATESYMRDLKAGTQPLRYVNPNKDGFR